MKKKERLEKYSQSQSKLCLELIGSWPQLMTKEEIHEFGLQILSRYLEANAYEIEMMHPNMQMFPHIIAKRTASLYSSLRQRMFILIKVLLPTVKRQRFWKMPLSLTRRQHVHILA